MITRTSTFFDRKTTDGAFAIHLRGRILVLLVQHRLAVGELAQALNCCDRVVRSLLAGEYRSLGWQAGTDIPGTTDAIDIKLAVHHEPADPLVPIQGTPDRSTGEREKLAAYLNLEVQRWLCTFEVADVDRQLIVENAGKILGESPLNEAGNFDFSVTRVFLDLISIWGRSARRPWPPDFKAGLGQWLASWIRFWVTDPEVWNPALDLAFAHFGDKAKAA